ncbi:MAG: hypothetical protein ACOX7C_00495 [Brevefilum sp.]|jgi:16S rRNA (guanine(1405)-N(7))-methyltransferase
MADDILIEDLVRQVQSNPKYRHMMLALLRRLTEDALSKGLTGKSVIKYVRNKCHQIGGAYFKKKFDLALFLQALENLPKDLNVEQARQFCITTMGYHASTAERLPILETFFQTCLAPIAPITSILDLACGLNPLALPWMPMAPTFSYTACDIYEDMLEGLQSYFAHFMIDGQTRPCDLIEKIPQDQAQVALILKSIPCLEQVDKEISPHMLENLQTDHILISYPAHSLGGRKKGMSEFYREHFYRLISGKPWHIREFVFSSELAFLVSK